MERIEKSIYQLPDIARRLRPQPTLYILVAVGGLCGTIMAVGTHTPEWLAGAYLLLAAVGALALLLLLCYYLFGDSRRPYHRPQGKLLEPEYLYYPASGKEALLAALANGDEAALARIKKTSAPDLVLVRYSDEQERIVFAQLQERDNGALAPITDIIHIIK